jgi:hypothetical protein
MDDFYLDCWVDDTLEISHTSTLEGIIRSVIKVEISHTTTLKGIIRSVIKVEISHTTTLDGVIRSAE